MKTREDENIAKYVERIKASVSAIKASRGDIQERIIVRKVYKLFFLFMQLEYLLFKR